MTCEHLHSLEQSILTQGIRETYRGQPWSHNCREWVYFDCYLDTAAIRSRLPLPDYVTDHIHRGTHDGEERGFVCSKCYDGIMGSYKAKPGMVVFRG
jgi:hypothetical protein